ncbi:MAG: glycosyltransferase [Pirellulaceae bacterium]|nr:glycosyltransferase [Planctomycetales bacterium]
MRVLLFALGTRGDVELLLSLGHVLATRGHQVQLASSPAFAERLANSQIDFVPIGTGTTDELQVALLALENIPDPWERTTHFFENWLRPQLRAASPTIQRLIGSTDMFVSNLKLVYRRGPRIVPTVAITYDLPRQTSDLEISALTHPEVLQIVPLPRPLADPERQWGRQFQFTNYWPSTFVSQTGVNHDEELARFLDNHHSPIAVIAGSMMQSTIGVLAASMTGVARELRRGLIIVGANSQAVHQLSCDDVLCLRQADFSSLFAQCGCVVHQASYGAAMAAVAAGVPSVCVPQIGCQYALATRLVGLRLSAGIIAALDPPATLLRTLHRAKTDGSIHDSLKKFEHAFRGQSGTETAVAWMEHHFDNLRHAI